MSTTIPVTVRVPTGTTTRAPTTGVAIVSGTEYVRRSSVGIGTATWTNTDRLWAMDFLRVFLPASCPPRPRASTRDYGGDRQDERSGSASRRDTDTSGRATARLD